MASVRHSVHLLKESCVDHAAAVALDEPTPIEVTIGNGIIGHLYIGDSELRCPSWMGLFDESVRDEIGEVLSGSVPAVLFVPNQGRLFALTFGHGRHLIKRHVRVPNFGLRVALNSISPKQGVRVLDTQSMDGRTMRYRTQAPKASALHDFGIDPEYTLLSSVTARATGSVLAGRTVVGRDSIQFTSDHSLQDIPDVLLDLYERFQREDYKDGFGWIDHVEQIRDEELQDSLDGDLVQAINRGEITKLWMAFPEIIDWESLDHFELRGTRNTRSYDDVSWEDYIERVDGAGNVNLISLKNHCIWVFGEGADRPIRKWPVYDCLYAELVVENQTFILNEGNWYVVSTSYLEQLNESVSRHIRPTQTFDRFEEEHVDEDGYIKCIAKKSAGDLAIMHGDGNLITRSGIRGSIEFCDLYSIDGRHCHLKQYSGSSTLSHLFNQGYVSTVAMLSDSDFCDRVREKLPDSHRTLFDEQCDDRSRISVVFGVIDTLKDHSFDLPIFSKIAFRETARKYASLGVNMTLEIIPSYHWNDRKRRRHE